MVKYRHRKQSDNVVSKGSTFEENKLQKTDAKVKLPDVFDRKNVEQTVTYSQVNRIMSNPQLVDTRFDEWYGGYSGPDVRVVPREFIRDTFKRARQVGLRMPWNEFRKAK
jgi:hypothetical protein